MSEIVPGINVALYREATDNFAHVTGGDNSWRFLLEAKKIRVHLNFFRCPLWTPASPLHVSRTRKRISVSITKIYLPFLSRARRSPELSRTFDFNSERNFHQKQASFEPSSSPTLSGIISNKIDPPLASRSSVFSYISSSISHYFGITRDCILLGGAKCTGSDVVERSSLHSTRVSLLQALVPPENYRVDFINGVRSVLGRVPGRPTSERCENFPATCFAVNEQAPSVSRRFSTGLHR